MFTEKVNSEKVEVTSRGSRWRERCLIPPGVSASCAPDLTVHCPYGLSAGPLKPDNSFESEWKVFVWRVQGRVCGWCLLKEAFFHCFVWGVRTGCRGEDHSHVTPCDLLSSTLNYDLQDLLPSDTFCSLTLFLKPNFCHLLPAQLSLQHHTGSGLNPA